MTFALWLLVLGVFTGLGLCFWGLVQVSDTLRTCTAGILEGLTRQEDPGTPEWYDDLYRRLADVEAVADSLPAKWDEFERQGVRRENRIRHVVSRAQEKLEELGYEDAGIEAEADELRRTHGEGGDRSPLQPVPGTVETPSNETGSAVPEGVEPWELETWQRKYGGN